MRFEYIVGVLATLATSGMADRMTIYEECSVTDCIRRNSLFFTDFGTYNIDASNGCRGTSVPGMVEFCVDIPRNRAHFRFGNQNKRCMVLASKSSYPCEYYYCNRAEFVEVGCSWREAPEEVGNTVSEVVTESVPTALPITFSTLTATGDSVL